MVRFTEKLPDLVYLEMLQAPRFTDISVNQWLGLTPAQVVEDHLHLPSDVIANLPKVCCRNVAEMSMFGKS